jgi:hypothetical protein
VRSPHTCPHGSRKLLWIRPEAPSRHLKPSQAVVISFSFSRSPSTLPARHRNSPPCLHPCSIPRAHVSASSWRTSLNNLQRLAWPESPARRNSTAAARLCRRSRLQRRRRSVAVYLP